MDKKNNKEFMEVLLKRTALVSVGATALRNQGAKGVVKSAREYLTKLNPLAFISKNEIEFKKILDMKTEKLRKYLPVGSQKWGVARKILNLYLREIFYNRYLCDYYEFNQIENWLEIPVDSYVGKGLKRICKSCPSWNGLKNHNKDDNDQYQQVAKKLASKKDLARVHLDIYLWRNIGIKKLQNLGTVF